MLYFKYTSRHSNHVGFTAADAKEEFNAQFYGVNAFIEQISDKLFSHFMRQAAFQNRVTLTGIRFDQISVWFRGNQQQMCKMLNKYENTVVLT